MTETWFAEWRTRQAIARERGYTGDDLHAYVTLGMEPQGAFSKIKAGLNDALAYASGERSGYRTHSTE